MSNTVNMGSVTFFINVSAFSNWIQLDDAKSLAKSLEDRFREKLEESDIKEYVTVTSVDWKYGCVMETFSFDLVSAGVLACTVAGGIIKYPDIRNGIIAIAKDIHNSYLYLKNKQQHKVLFIEDKLYLEHEVKLEKQGGNK
jgi:hypothetical protein